jgi:hypothetical protein
MKNKIKLLPLLLVSATLVACGSGGSSINGNPSDVGNPIEIVNPPIEIVNPPIEIVNPPIEIVNPPIEIVNPIIDRETKIKVTPDSPEEIMGNESFNFSVISDGGSADSIIVGAKIVNSSDWLISPTMCKLPLGGAKSCHFSAFATNPARFDPNLAKVLPLSYAVANNSSYRIKVTAVTNNNAQVESSPVLDFSLYTPVTDPNAVITEGPRFTPGTGNEYDCITDNLTGLMWAKDASLLGQAIWDDALDKVAAMNGNNISATANALCGHKDWHLPTVNELASLTNNESFQSLLGQVFIRVQASYYWSSTSYAPRTGGVWYVNFNNGNVPANPKSNRFYVWPVRRVW